MFRKDNVIRWTSEAKQSFVDIKKSLTKAPMLISPYFTRYLCYFHFPQSIQLQGFYYRKNDQNWEQPIAFYNKALRDSTLKYDIMEK